MRLDFTHYDPKTGRILGHFSTTNPATVPLNVTPERPAIAGLHDHMTKRVNLETLQVEDHVHEPSALDKKHQLLSQISSMEANQHRIVREILLGKVNSGTGADGLRAIDNDIAALRQQLKTTGDSDNGNSTPNRAEAPAD